VPRRESLAGTGTRSGLPTAAPPSASRSSAFRTGSIETLYSWIIAPAMWRIGCLWEEEAITIADEHLATALTHRVMASAYGSTFGRATSTPGRILLAAVEGQRHSLGLRMAADVLELSGYEVIYLGGDVPLEALAGSIAAREPELVGLSSTLPPEKSSLETAIARLQKDFPAIPLMLGGQGVTAKMLRGDKVIDAPSVEGLATLTASLLGRMEGISTGATGAEPVASGAQTDHSPEGLMLGAAADAADLARIHARMATRCSRPISPSMKRRRRVAIRSPSPASTPDPSAPGAIRPTSVRGRPRRLACRRARPIAGSHRSRPPLSVQAPGPLPHRKDACPRP
jgi:methylmalonyl-CoA mutase cobalamin-binding subunit